MDECIVRTLAYFDIFDYPLTFSQIKKYLCCPIDISDEEMLDILDAIPVVHEFEGFYYLMGRNKLASFRRERSEISIQKFVKARIISKILSKIPTINYIGVSGSLSMNNAANSDDIDLFFITKKNTLWLTRLLVNIALILFGQKRRRGERYAKDKICPNMFVSFDSMPMAKNGKSIYLAHEIVQLKTLFDRGGIHSAFIDKNKWVKKIFPNFEFEVKKSKIKEDALVNLLYPLEKLLYTLQWLYMRKRIGVEKVNQKEALFHPFNRKKVIMQLYKARCKMYLNLLSENSWIDNEDARFFLDEKKIRILN